MQIPQIKFSLALKLYNALCAVNPTSVCTRRADTDDFHKGAAKAAEAIAAFLFERMGRVVLPWTGPIVGLPPGTSPEERAHVTIDGGRVLSLVLRRRGAPTFAAMDVDVQQAATALGATLERVGAEPVPGTGQPTTYRLAFNAKDSIRIEGDEGALMALGLRRGAFERIDFERMMLTVEHLADDLLVDDAQTGSRIGDGLLRAESAIRAVSIFVEHMGGIPRDEPAVDAAPPVPPKAGGPEA